MRLSAGCKRSLSGAVNSMKRCARESMPDWASDDLAENEKQSEKWYHTYHPRTRQHLHHRRERIRFLSENNREFWEG
jgi:hypothetical protein